MGELNILDSMDDPPVKRIPLSQQPGKRKLLTGLPASILCAILAYFGFATPVTRLAAVILGAYAIIGLVEIIAGDSLAATARKWDTQPGWKKFIISLAVIITAIGFFMVIMPFVAILFQKQL